jgi:hypothetical protein
LQIAARLCLPAQSLHGCEYVRLLRRKRIPELLQPGKVAVQGGQYDWERH